MSGTQQTRTWTQRGKRVRQQRKHPQDRPGIVRALRRGVLGARWARDVPVGAMTLAAVVVRLASERSSQVAAIDARPRRSGDLPGPVASWPFLGTWAAQIPPSDPPSTIFRKRIRDVVAMQCSERCILTGLAEACNCTEADGRDARADIRCTARHDTTRGRDDPRAPRTAGTRWRLIFR